MFDGKKQYEIMNPSDPYTVLAKDDVTAAVAILFLGRGKLSLTDEEGDEVLPLFLLAGEGYLEEWLEGVGVEDLGKFLEENALEVADVLDSAMIGDFSTRASYQKGLELIDNEEKREEWREHWLDKRRTSVNDIGTAAWTAAASLREAYGKE